MEDLVFTANAVLPTFLTIMVGWFVVKIKMFDDNFVRNASKLSFRVFLPVLLFYNISTSDPNTCFDAGLALYVVGGTVLIFGILMLIVPHCEKQVERRSVIIQALFRSNYLIMAVPMCDALFGDEGRAVASVLSAFIIPTFNTLAVIVLSIYDKTAKHGFWPTFGRIFKNPLIIASLCGIAALLLHVQFPKIIDTTLSSICSMATPFALVVLGMDFKLDVLKGNFRVLSVVTLFRLLIVPLIMTSLAILLGFRGAQFVTIMMVFASPTAVSSYIMAREAHADHQLAGQIVVMTSLFSVFTLFLFIFLSKTLGFI